MINHYKSQNLNVSSSSQEKLERLQTNADEIIHDAQLKFSDSIESITNNFFNDFRQSLQDELVIILQKIHSQNVTSLRKSIDNELINLPIFDSLDKQDKDIIAKIFSKISQRILQKLIL